jgi:hypothetical protein
MKCLLQNISTGNNFGKKDNSNCKTESYLNKKENANNLID